jgi:hypothetical protein
MFAPCFIGNPISKTRRNDYIRLLLSFIFWISIIEIIYFIVEICVGGLVSFGQNPMIGPGGDTLVMLGNFKYFSI